MEKNAEKLQAIENEKKIGTQIPFTDLGNAESLALFHGNKIRFVHGDGAKGQGWHIWTGTHWRPDRTQEVYNYADDIARKRQQAVLTYEHDADRKKRNLREAILLENRHKAYSCLEQAKHLKPITTTQAELDTNPYLLACPNGTLDLKTGQLREPRPEDMITMCTGVNYNPNATSELWSEFLETTFILPNGEPDLGLIKNVRLAKGYSLTGSDVEHCFFLGYGGGRNGKSTLYYVARSVLGSYAADVPFDSFILDRNQQTNDLAMLRGKRFVTAFESERNKKLAESRIKSLTGGDPLTVRFLWNEFFTYEPQFKVWLGTNHLPKITGTDNAIWSRVKLIPFKAQFDKGVNDILGLKYKLANEEGEAILSWMVDGCRSWLEAGYLEDCITVKEATKEYRLQEDWFGKFIEDMIQPEQDHFFPNTELMAAWAEWSSKNGYSEMKISIDGIGKRLANRGYSKHRTDQGRGFLHIKVNPLWRLGT